MREGGRHIPPTLFLAIAEEGFHFDKLAGFLFMLVITSVSLMKLVLQFPPQKGGRTCSRQLPQLSDKHAQERVTT